MIRVYLPYSGVTIHGFGDVRKTVKSDRTIHKYVFIANCGRIFFNKVSDSQVKGMVLISEITQDMLPQ